MAHQNGSAHESEEKRFQEIYDVKKYVTAAAGGVFVEDPYPAFAQLRGDAPVHKGAVAQLLGFDSWPTLYPDAPHYSTFSFEASNIALRENLVFSSEYLVGGGTAMLGNTLLNMVGEEHRRYRSLVQSAFSPTKAQWWLDRWITALVDETIVAFETNGSADLNIELCAPIPLMTITASFGLNRTQALDFREKFVVAHGADPTAAYAFAAEMLRPLIEARRTDPKDDLISFLISTEIENDGRQQRLTDEEITSFGRLVLGAGSGTTWRQLGILLVGLLRDPASMKAVLENRSLLRNAVDEAIRWEATDTIFRRLVTQDTTLCGVSIPAGAVLEVNLGAANRDPTRWDDPDRFDIFRVPQVNLGFASGPHVCLGMHVARTEMLTAANAILDRLPRLRFDPSILEPQIVGLEHRGPTSVPVVFG